jgi:hypothetical protein
MFEHKSTQSIQDELNKAFIHLGEAAFKAAWAEGQVLTFDQVISTIDFDTNPSGRPAGE